MKQVMDCKDAHGNPVLVTATTEDDPDLEKLVAAHYIIGGSPNIGKLLGIRGNEAERRLVNKNYDTFQKLYTATRMAPPPVAPGYYIDIYRRCPTTRAVIDARVAAVVGLGYNIKPNLEPELDGNTIGAREPDSDQKDKMLSVLENCLPYMSFQELLEALWLDYEISGNAYLELVRSEGGDLDGFGHLKSVAGRLSNDYQYIFQVDGYMPVRAFGRYGSQISAMIVQDRVQKIGRTEYPYFSVEQAIRAGQEIPVDKIGGMLQDDQRMELANEMVHLRNYTPMATDYGEPPVLSAVEDYIGSLNARLYNVSYFNNATVPRMMIIVKGGALSPDTEAKIQNFVKDQEAIDALNQVLVLSMPDSVEVTIERLSQEQLKDAGFLEYRKDCDDKIRMAYRMSASWLGITEGGGRQQITETNQKVLWSVIRPNQVKVENVINRVFRDRLGITDYSFALRLHQVMDPEVFAQTRNLFLQRGVLNPNDVLREMEMPPIPGGDVNCLFPMGMGAVPVESLPMIAKQMAAGNVNALELQPGVANPDGPVGKLQMLVAPPEGLTEVQKTGLYGALQIIESLSVSGDLENVLAGLNPKRNDDEDGT